MKERLFKFKQFDVSHARSSMPIGVDGVLIGAWATCEGEKLLDVGTGCGVIALMLAQRNRQARILAIDVDAPSVEEAASNFKRSVWSDRIESKLMSFEAMIQKGEKFDNIVSNPPYFDSGVKQSDNRRMIARHVGSLSPLILLECCGMLLNDNGRLSMIVPVEMLEQLKEKSSESCLSPVRECFVRDNVTTPNKRVMIEFIKNKDEIKPSENSKQCGSMSSENLIMFDSNRNPTEEYRKLCGDFYLKF